MKEHDYIDFIDHKAIRKKALQALLGICHGIMADNELNEKEFLYLRHWILENAIVSEEWPGNLLMKKINKIMSDGRITRRELDHFQEVLSQLIGGTLEETGTSQGNSTALPVNNDAVVTVSGKTFCFTGEMIYGPRKTCAEVTEALGGTVLSSVRKDLDYLVIGTIAPGSWANTSYGRKIQKAIEQQEKGLPTLIIDEQMWTAALSLPTAGALR